MKGRFLPEVGMTLLSDRWSGVGELAAQPPILPLLFFFANARHSERSEESPQKYVLCTAGRNPLALLHTTNNAVIVS